MCPSQPINMKQILFFTIINKILSVCLFRVQFKVSFEALSETKFKTKL